MQKVNIIIGRFQPFTYGHLKCIQNIYQEKHLKTVVLMIDTINPSIKNPYKSSLLLPIYNEALRDYKEIEGIILIKNANIITISEELNKYGYQIFHGSLGNPCVGLGFGLPSRYQIPTNYRTIRQR